MAFINTDLDPLVEMSEGMNSITYSSEKGRLQIEITNETPTLQLNWKMNDNQFKIDSQLTGGYNVHNIAAAIAIGVHFDVNPKDISSAISEYIPENNRSQLKDTGKNLLIMDAYNANPSSLRHALVNLSKMETREKYFIIGDMLELGKHSEFEHKAIIQLAKELNLEGILVGKEFCSAAEGEYKCFSDNVEACEYAKKENITNKTVLIKGSRGIRLEELAKVL